eukprot:4609683-Pleurochrysis_carterae.AAC.1
MAADLSLGPAVKLLAGQPPDDSESRAASFDNELCGGRWGTTTGEHAAGDIRDGVVLLGELLSLAHAHAGGGVRGEAPDFGLGALARLAC